MMSVLKENRKPIPTITIGVLTGVSLAISWIYPGTPVAAVFGWFSACGLIACAYHFQKKPYLTLSIAGTVFYIIAGYWFFDAVKDFTESGTLIALLFCIPFLLWHAAQFLLYGVLFHFLPKTLEQYSLRASLAWVSIEWLWPRQFPWTIGHTQLAFTSLAQSAELFGSFGISFLVFLFSEQIYHQYKNGIVRTRAISYTLAFLLIVSLGIIRIQSIDIDSAQSVRTGVVLGEKEPGRSSVGLESYLKHTNSIIDSSELVIWPERAITSKIHESIGHRDNDQRLPHLKEEVPLIMGVKTYRPPHKTFNSVMLIDKDGTVPVPYHKRFLMPFGEFLPTPKLFHWLGLSSYAPKSGLTAGTRAVVYEVASSSSPKNVMIAPLICYEDLKPELAQLALHSKANLLIDLSSGSWSKHTLPLYQHQTLAAFRSIETRRSFLRLSKVGPSVLIYPTGNIRSLFKKGNMYSDIIDIPVINIPSYYQLFAEHFPIFVFVFCLFSIALKQMGILLPRKKSH